MGSKRKREGAVGTVVEIRKRPFSAAPSAPHYDFKPLLAQDDNLRKHAKLNAKGEWTIDFTSRDATLALTCAILKFHFHLTLHLPAGQLVPTIPNRVQYLLWAASLLGDDMAKRHLVAVDIGTGPSCIYPLLASRLFPQWKFVATDTDEQAIVVARQNCDNNSLQSVKTICTSGGQTLLPYAVLKEKPYLTVCNPPFHETLPKKPDRAGTEEQLCTDGGELSFLSRLARESRNVSQIKWFTSLIGCKADLPKVVAFLRSEQVRAPIVKHVELSQGGRTTRWAVAWSFGDEVSNVHIVRELTSKWRCAISVKPGRQYANCLESEDIDEIFNSALRLLEWRSSCASVSSSEGTRKFHHGSAADPSERAEIHVDCMAKDGVGIFEVHVKVDKKGAMSPNSFCNLGKSICAMVSALLNDGDPP